MTRYVVTGRPTATSPLAAVIGDLGVGEEFDADLDEITEAALVGAGSVQVLTETTSEESSDAGEPEPAIEPEPIPTSEPESVFGVIEQADDE